MPDEAKPFVQEAEDPANLSRCHLAGYTLDFIDLGSSTLVVTFENAGAPKVRPNRQRPGWGVSFVTRHGFSSLAVKPLVTDWYRGRDLHVQFRAMKAVGFFDPFEKVLFYGGSMGGYGALAFSRLIPGSHVLALSPQTTLDQRIVPWEKRFPEGSAQDWDGDFSDGADCGEVGTLALCYDPFAIRDRRHIDRIRHPGAIHCKMPFTGHFPIVRLAEINKLAWLFRAVLGGEVTAAAFAAQTRERRELASYWLLAHRAAKTPALALACLNRARERGATRSAHDQEMLRHFFRWKRYAEAEGVAREILAQNPRLHWVRDRLAESLSQQDAHDDARAVIEAGLALHPEQPLLSRRRILIDRADAAARVAGPS